MNELTPDPSFWSKHKKKFYVAGGILLGAVAALVVFSQDEVEPEEESKPDLFDDIYLEHRTYPHPEGEVSNAEEDLPIDSDTAVVDPEDDTPMAL